MTHSPLLTITNENESDVDFKLYKKQPIKCETDIFCFDTVTLSHQQRINDLFFALVRRQGCFTGERKQTNGTTAM